MKRAIKISVCIALAIALLITARVIIQRQDAKRVWEQFWKGYQRPVGYEKYTSYTELDSNGSTLKGLKDSSGKVVIEAKYFNISRFVCNNRIAIKFTENEAGYIDRLGNVVVPPRYFLTDDFVSGLGVVTSIDKRGWPLRGVVDVDGNTILDTIYHSIAIDEDGFILAGLEQGGSKIASDKLKSYENLGWRGIKKYYIFDDSGRQVSVADFRRWKRVGQNGSVEIED